MDSILFISSMFYNSLPNKTFLPPSNNRAKLLQVRLSEEQSDVLKMASLVTKTAHPRTSEQDVHPLQPLL